MSSQATTKITVKNPTMGPYTPTLILHGGAGVISRATLPPVLYERYHASLESYLISTKSLLESGGTATDAACHAVSLMEDDPLFNCGHGSVFTTRGEIEMEASLAVTSILDGNGETTGQYDGRIKKSAAVSMVRRTRHPILLAREVLKMGDADEGLGRVSEMHGHLSGHDVEKWGWEKKGLERKPRRWFWTKRRWDEHRKDLARQPGHHDHTDIEDGYSSGGEGMDLNDEDGDDCSDEFLLPTQETVGAVCLDSWGTIAAATSTGGLTNKLPGRIGDTPTVGAGFWAESWDEQVEEDEGRESPEVELQAGSSLLDKVTTAAKQGFDFWVGDCVNTSSPVTNSAISGGASSIKAIAHQNISEKQTLLHEIEHMTYPASKTVRRRAVAMSGTGNGDSFLRTNACRTAAAMSRFAPSGSVPLAKAVQAIAGPGGELQRSAGKRWNKLFEGEGGIIGIELLESDEEKREGNVVYDFNCGGLWRAYYKKDKDGNEKPKVMVFREEY